MRTWDSITSFWEFQDLRTWKISSKNWKKTRKLKNNRRLWLEKTDNINVEEVSRTESATSRRNLTYKKFKNISLFSNNNNIMNCNKTINYRLIIKMKMRNCIKRRKYS